MALTGTPVVVLAGGTGGAKLARGMLDVVGGAALTVVANTGDDVEIYGAHVSPDPDLVSFWLADRIDERGWGLAGDTFTVMDALRELGVEVWFNLGDRDLAWCLERRRMMNAGLTATEAMGRLTAALGLEASVLPMCDQPVRTRVLAGAEWHPLQEFMIRLGAAGPVQDVELEGVEAAQVPQRVAAALRDAQAIVIGPSNPVISIDPILSVGGMRDALRAASAPVVAVSPIVEGQVVKGPTAEFMRFAGRALSAAGVAEHYAGVIDAIVADEPLDPPPSGAAPVLLRTATMMDSAAARRRLAEETLTFALALGSGSDLR